MSVPYEKNISTLISNQPWLYVISIVKLDAYHFYASIMVLIVDGSLEHVAHVCSQLIKSNF